MQDEEELEASRRPFSPYYWALRKVLDNAGVELVPTDRDVAPLYDDREDGDEQDGEAQQESRADESHNTRLAH